MFDLYISANKMMSLMNKSADYPANYHKTARTLSQIFRQVIKKKSPQR